MHLQRFKQGHMNIRRKYGVHGRMVLNHEKIGGEKVIYTLESPWNPNKDEPNGILGLSCVAPGNYNLSIEQSPVNKRYYPFLVNESKNVCLKSKVKAHDKTGHAFVDYESFNPLEIYGRFILCGTSYRFDPKGYYAPVYGEEAVSIIKAYIEATGDKSLTISWG